VTTIASSTRSIAVFGFILLGLGQVGPGPVAASEPVGGFVGLQVQGVNSAMMAALGLDAVKGVLVRDVAAGGPADLAGIRRGDLLLKLAGQEIDSTEQLIQVVNKTTSDQIVPVSVFRAGKTVELRVKLGPWPQARKVDRDATGHLPEAGLTMVALTPKMRDRFSVRWSSVGVLVTLVDESKVAGIGIKRGEIIYQINQEDIWLPDQIIARYKQAKTAKRPSLLLLIEGAEGFRYMTLPVR